ncbi:MAG: 50S ribosomal protein L4 [Chloroflexota bacterium]
MPVYDSTGVVVREMELRDEVFAVPFNEGLVHQCLMAQLANRRQGNAATKTRGEVHGSTRKLHAQKHTGRARAGDLRSPVFRHGGTVFGPHPHSYAQKVSKTAKRLALRCVLSAKVRDGEFKIIDNFSLDRPHTKTMKGILACLELGGSVLVVTAGSEPNVIKSAANLPGVRTLPVALLNVADMVAYGKLLATEAATEKAVEIWGRDASAEGGASEVPGR